MKKNTKRSRISKPHIVPSEFVVEEVLNSIERVDREIEKFYEIHGTELKDADDPHSEIRRG